MAYGMKIDGAEGIYQVDGSTSSTSFLTIVHNGTTLNSSPYAISNYSAGDIVFARPTSGSGRFCSDFTVSTPTFNVQASYLILRPSSNISSAVSGSGVTYGIQIKNAANTVIFDSRAFSGSGGSALEIEEIHPRMTLLGADQPNTFDASNALDPGNNTFNKTVFNAGDSTTLAKTYVSVMNGFNFQPNSSTNSQIINGYHFENGTTNYRVLYEGYIKSPASQGIIGNSIRLNDSVIMAATLKT